jgi:hypothetical protein
MTRSATALHVPALSAEPFAQVPDVPLEPPPPSWGARVRWLLLPPVAWAALVVPALLRFNDRLKGSMCCLTSGPTDEVILGGLLLVGALWLVHLALVGVASLIARRSPLTWRAVGPTVLLSVPVVLGSAVLAAL